MIPILLPTDLIFLPNMIIVIPLEKLSVKKLPKHLVSKSKKLMTKPLRQLKLLMNYQLSRIFKSVASVLILKIKLNSSLKLVN